jgi:hypothetical protein
MDKIARLSRDERSEIIQETARRIDLTPSAVEKDFWVVWTLDKLFRSPLLADKIIFKGGTSLSKVFGLIRRFSEDIDLILDWNEVVAEDPNLERSKNKQAQFNKSVSGLSRKYIADVFLPEVVTVLDGVCFAEIEEGAPDVINIRYPSGFESDYLRPEIRLEIGPLAMWVPNAEYEIKPYMAEAFPDVFEVPSCKVKAIKAERTFWEKATILHAEAFRPESKQLSLRYSRHYYDLAMMAADPSVKVEALINLDLLHTVAEFKAKFYPASWANYDLARPGTFRLMPTEKNIGMLAHDYEQMKVMLFGEVPPFNELLESLQALEAEINALESE